MCSTRHGGIEMRPFMQKAAVCAVLPALFAFLTACSMVATEKTAAPVQTFAAEQPAASAPSAYLKVEAEPQPGTGAAAAGPAQTRHRIYQYMPDSSPSQATEGQLSDISRDVAGKVFYELKEDGEKNYSARVAVVAAVPLSDLKRETEFGRVMAEYLLTDLADRGLKVTELRLGKEINIIAQNGEFILSRNIGELANTAPVLDYVVVSTFSNTRKTLIIQGRLVSLQDGTVVSSWRHTMPLTRDLLSFFHTGEQPLTIAVKGMNN